MTKYDFKRKALARDWLNKLEGNMRSMIIANAKTAGELCDLNWKQIQVMPLKDFQQLLLEFNEHNELGDNVFLGNE